MDTSLIVEIIVIIIGVLVTLGFLNKKVLTKIAAIKEAIDVIIVLLQSLSSTSEDGSRISKNEKEKLIKELKEFRESWKI